jgi:hypothetical protein
VGDESRPKRESLLTHKKFSSCHNGLQFQIEAVNDIDLLSITVSFNKDVTLAGTCKVRLTLTQYFITTSIQFKSIHFNSIQVNSFQFNSIQFNSIQFNLINSIQFNVHSYQ